MITLEIKANINNPVAIVEEMKNHAYYPEGYKTLDDYIEFLKMSLLRFNNFSLQVDGETLENRCITVINQLKNGGFIKLS